MYYLIEYETYYTKNRKIKFECYKELKKHIEKHYDDYLEKFKYKGLNINSAKDCIRFIMQDAISYTVTTTSSFKKFIYW